VPNIVPVVCAIQDLLCACVGGLSGLFPDIVEQYWPSLLMSRCIGPCQGDKGKVSFNVTAVKCRRSTHLDMRRAVPSYPRILSPTQSLPLLCSLATQSCSTCFIGSSRYCPAPLLPCHSLLSLGPRAQPPRGNRGYLLHHRYRGCVFSFLLLSISFWHPLCYLGNT